MEPHPVPQDILNTEFQLFGSFTLKQFMKLLGACLIGLLIFFIPGLPGLIKFPLVLVSVLTGIAMALMPRFDIWLTNYIKAIFISPRYVWIKEAQTPEILNRKELKKLQNSQKVTSAKAGKRVDLDGISIERLLAARDDPRKSTPSAADPINEKTKARDKNLDRVLGDVYKGVKPKISPTKPAKSKAKARAEGRDPLFSEKQDYVDEINKLKKDLATMVKDQNHKENEARILERINDIMHDLRMLGASDHMLPKQPKKKGEVIRDFQGQKVAEGQMVFGLVVDKKGKPIADAKVVFDDVGDKRDVLAKTDQQGKFISKMGLIEGEYNITIDHPGLKFHTYKIKVEPGKKLPAYKLRAR